MIRAAFFDIDGTLLSFKTHRVSDGTLRAFAKLRGAGVKTFLSTGRPPVLIPQMPVAFDGYITMNGGLVYTGSDTLRSNPIPGADYGRWLDYAGQHNICTMVFDRETMAVAQPTETGYAIQRQLDMPMPPLRELDELRGVEAYQVIALMPPADDAAVGRLLPGCRMPRWHELFTDIVADGNSKAVGMDAICRRFGIGQADTIAFGDGGNDVEMLRWAGIGIAMGNASEVVKASADMVTADVDHEGIEQAIDQLLAGV